MALSINFVCHVGPTMASTRYRVMIPALELQKKGYIVSAGEMSPSSDVYIFSKHFSDLDPMRAKRATGLVVYDICDNHFGTDLRDYYLEMCSYADVLTCPTEEMARQIQTHTGRKAYVISDPYEFEQKKASFDPDDPVKLLWFGHGSNLDSLLLTIPQLHDYELTVVTNGELNLTRRNATSILPWNIYNMRLGFSVSDIVIIPAVPGSRKAAKSTNRIVEAIRQGKFVVANSCPSYEQFSPWMYIGDIQEGINWALIHKDEVTQRIEGAQEYVEQHFNPKHVGDLWEKALLSSISEQAIKDSKVISM